MEETTPEEYMAKPLQALLVVSDLHCGSTVGLCPPMCPLIDDGGWILNEVQDDIWDKWTAFSRWACDHLKGTRWGLVVNGDAIEGVHHGCKQIVHADPGVHARIAVEVLKPLAAKASAVYITKGTGAHVGHMSENGIGEALGAVRHPDTGQRAAHHWLIRVNGCLVSFKHHIGTSKRKSLYATQLSAELAEERLASADASKNPPSVIVRSHRHTFGCYENAGGMAITTPAWQALTSFGWKVVPSAVPEFGGVILDWRGIDNGKLPGVLPWVKSGEGTTEIEA